MKIDAHQHFWQYDSVKHAWIDDSMSVLKQNFLPIDLKESLEESGIDGSVVVQADQSEAETNFLLGLAENHALIKGVVGWIDLKDENVEERLEFFSSFPKLKGFRHVVQDEPDVNFMLGESFQSGLSLLSKYGFTYDILVFPKQLDASIETVSRLPNQKFVLDHIAKPAIKTGEISEWAQKIRTLGKHEQLYCKLSGMVTEADWAKWEKNDFVPYLDIVIESFGVDRVMYGSDWPVCLLGGNYSEVKGIVDDYFSSYSEEEKSKIFGENAISFYELEK